MKAELVLDAKATIGESPTWVAAEAALYWADIKAPALHRFYPDSGATNIWQLSADIGGFALDGNGRALVALRTGLFWLTLETGKLDLRVAAPFNPQLIRFNEAACDSRGRFWVGTMTDPLDGAKADIKGLLYSFTAEDGLAAHADFAFITNGMAWNADESIFYVSHSTERIIYEFSYDIETGSLARKSEFARLTDSNGIPDGAAMDAAGNYWCAIHGAGCLHRYSPAGVLEERIALPVSQPTMCCFAGPGLEDLYVTSAREKLSVDQLKAQPYAGGLFKLRPAVSGQPRPWRVA